VRIRRIRKQDKGSELLKAEFGVLGGKETSKNPKIKARDEAKAEFTLRVNEHFAEEAQRRVWGF
jgi:hypothetical protein